MYNNDQAAAHKYRLRLRLRLRLFILTYERKAAWASIIAPADGQTKQSLTHIGI